MRIISVPAYLSTTSAIHDAIGGSRVVISDSWYFISGSHVVISGFLDFISDSQLFISDFSILPAIPSSLSAVSRFYQRFPALYQRFLGFISDSQPFISGFSILSAILGSLSAVSRFYQRFPALYQRFSRFYQRFSALYQRFLDFTSDPQLFISGFSILSAILGSLSAIFSILSAIGILDGASCRFAFAHKTFVGPSGSSDAPRKLCSVRKRSDNNNKAPSQNGNPPTFCRRAILYLI